MQLHLAESHLTSPPMVKWRMPASAALAKHEGDEAASFFPEGGVVRRSGRPNPAECMPHKDLLSA